MGGVDRRSPGARPSRGHRARSDHLPVGSRSGVGSSGRRSRSCTSVVLVPVLAGDQRWTMLWATGLFVAFVVLVQRRTALLRAAGLQVLPAMAIVLADAGGGGDAVARARRALPSRASRRSPIRSGSSPRSSSSWLAWRTGGDGRPRWRTPSSRSPTVPRASVRDLLAEALRDPTVEVAFAVPGEGRATVGRRARSTRGAAVRAAGGRSSRSASMAALVAELASAGRLRRLAQPARGRRVGDGSRRRERPLAVESSAPGRAAGGLAPSPALDRRRGAAAPRRAARTRSRRHDGPDARRARPAAFRSATTPSMRPRSGVAPGWRASTAISTTWPTGLGPAVLTRGGLTQALGQLADSSPVTDRACP